MKAEDVIDWSKAPEGTTRYHPETQFTSAHWWKPGQFCNVGFEEDGWQLHRKELQDQSKYVNRPPEWDGVGLPPVGAICEHEPSTLGEEKWQQVTIIAHHEIEGEICAVWAKGTLVSWSPADLFRALPTTETEKEIRAKELYYRFFDGGSWALTSEATREIFRKVSPSTSPIMLAAPKLLEALEGLYESYRKICVADDCDPEATAAADRAISEARGMKKPAELDYRAGRA